MQKYCNKKDKVFFDRKFNIIKKLIFPTLIYKLNITSVKTFMYLRTTKLIFKFK